MNRNQNRKTPCRLAASLRGSRLTLEPALRKTLEEQLMHDIRAVGASRMLPDKRAFAESVRWERLGDFLFRAGVLPGAVKAYLEATLSCLNGDYYDHGRESFPCRFLRLRFFDLLDKALARCGGDPRLERIVRDDAFLHSEYLRMRRGC